MIIHNVYPSDQRADPNDTPATFIHTANRPDVKTINRSYKNLKTGNYVLHKQNQGYLLFPDDKITTFEFEVKSPTKGKDLFLNIGTVLRADNAIMENGCFKSKSDIQFRYKTKAMAHWKQGYGGPRIASKNRSCQWDVIRGQKKFSCAPIEHDTYYSIQIIRDPKLVHDNLVGDLMLHSANANWIFHCDCDINQLIAKGCQCGGV